MVQDGIYLTKCGHKNRSTDRFDLEHLTSENGSNSGTKWFPDSVD